LGYQQDLSPAGSLAYNDHTIDFSFKSTAITSYVPGFCLAEIGGTARSKAGPVQFEVVVTDGGEPGTNDTFTIHATGPGVPGGDYLVSGPLQGGDVQAHGFICP
jgi:hypothetical protein